MELLILDAGMQRYSGGVADVRQRACGGTRRGKPSPVVYSGGCIPFQILGWRQANGCHALIESASRACGGARFGFGEARRGTPDEITCGGRSRGEHRLAGRRRRAMIRRMQQVIHY
jgi:hypothetical protein